MVMMTAGSPHWYSKNISASHYSSPAVVPVGPGGQMEIVDGFPDGTVQGWSDDGTHLWTFNTGAGAVQASPLIVDLNGDGLLDIVTANTVGNVWAFTPALNNKVIFNKKTGDGVHEPGDFATPAVADINKDGKLDVIETSWDHHIHVWSGKGTHKELPGFPVFLQDTSWSSPAVADIDGDGWPEIAFGYDCAGVAGQNCHPHPRRLRRRPAARRQVGEGLAEVPAPGDLVQPGDRRPVRQRQEGDRRRQRRHAEHQRPYALRPHLQRQVHQGLPGPAERGDHLVALRR